MWEEQLYRYDTYSAVDPGICPGRKDNGGHVKGKEILVSKVESKDSYKGTVCTLRTEIKKVLCKKCGEEIATNTIYFYYNPTNASPFLK